MDKKVDLKKLPTKRKKSVPLISIEETVNYLRCYFIPEDFSIEDKQIMKQINSEIKKKRTSYKSQDVSKKNIMNKHLLAKKKYMKKC